MVRSVEFEKGITVGELAPGRLRVGACGQEPAGRGGVT